MKVAVLVRLIKLAIMMVMNKAQAEMSGSNSRQVAIRLARMKPTMVTY